MPTIQNIQKTVEFPQVQFFDKDNVLALAFVLGFFPGSFNVEITRATVLTIVGESVRSLLFVIMLTHLVTGRFSQYKQRDYRFYDHDQQVLGCKPRDFPAALALGASLLLRRSIGMARRSACIQSCTSGRSAGIVVSSSDNIPSQFTVFPLWWA